MRYIFRESDVFGCAFNFGIELDDNAIVYYGNMAGSNQDTIRVKSGGGKQDVVVLPFAGLTAGIGQRDTLFINGSCLSIGVGAVLVTIQNLNLVSVLQKNTAGPSPLTFTFYNDGFPKFKVQLNLRTSS